MYPSIHRRARHLLAIIGGAALAATMLAPLSAGAQDASFEAAVTAARAATQERLDAANLASEEGMFESSPERQLMTVVAEHVPTIVAELQAYADFLEGQTPPAELAGDVAAHASGLREVAEAMAAVVSAAAEGDQAGAEAGYAAAADVLASLAAEVDGDYFDLAFVSPFRERFTSFKGLSAEELAYLDGVRDAALEFERRNREAFEAILRSYPTAEAMMRALYEAGAGEAFPAVEAKALELTPPARFVDEHEWWLARLVELSRLDRIIGEAARDGDALGFVTINNQMTLVGSEDGLMASLYPEFDPAFGAAMQPGGPTSRSLDPASAIGRDPYGQALFHLLRTYAALDPSGNAVRAASDFPGVTDELRLTALDGVADEYEALWAEFEDALAVLEPSTAWQADHARLLAFADEHGQDLGALLDAARDGDVPGAFAAVAEMEASFCAAANDLSEDIGSAARVYLDPTFPVCT